jgi:mannose-6-phosphate isomerase
MNLEGAFEVEYESGKEEIEKGETVLIPASVEQYKLNPLTKSTKTLEVYIK